MPNTTNINNSSNNNTTANASTIANLSDTADVSDIADLANIANTNDTTNTANTANTKEQTIIAYFPSSTKAETAIQALSSVGLTDTSTQRNSRYGVSPDKFRDDSLNLQAESQIGLTLFSADSNPDTDRSTRVLLGADPSVSGNTARSYGMAGGHAFTVVAFVPPERVDEAVNLLKQNGGEV